LAVLSVYRINREDHSENLRKLAEIDNARTLIP